MTPFVFVLGALASWRLASLVTEDQITRPLRSAVTRRAVGRDRWRPAVVLVFCVRCLGVWMSLATFAAIHAVGLADDRRLCVLAVLASAAVVNLCSGLGG